jgi:hypothetical protein
MPYIQLQFRRGTASEWSTVNPILADGEMGLETDTRRTKIGDGVLNWNDLPYGLGLIDFYTATNNGNTTNVAVNISNTDPSTDTVTGAFTVAGGVGIGGNLNVGGDLTADNLNVSDITLGEVIGNAANVIVDTSPVAIDSFDINAFTTSKYIVQAINGTDYHSMEAFLVNDTIDPLLTVYASVTSANDLISLDANVYSGNVTLWATGVSAGNNVKVFSTKL